MGKEKNLYGALFASTFRLSAFTFGGGYVIVPLMRRQFVEKLHWLEEDEMIDLTAIAQSAPGPIAVNASILVGYRLAGVPGALVTMLGTVLPPLIILSVISLFYAAFRSNPVVNLVMKGMNAAVAAVICDVVLRMGSAVLKDRKILPPIMMGLAFIATWFFKVNVMVILLACGVVGGATMVWHERREGGGRA